MSKGYDFIHLNLEPLVVSIQSNARSWVKSIGKLLNQAAKENLNNLKGELEVILRFTLWVLLFITCLKCSIKVSVMEFLAKIVKLWFSDDFKRGGEELFIHSELLNIRNEIWAWFVDVLNLSKVENKNTRVGSSDLLLVSLLSILNTI